MLDGITLHCITNELANILKGGQISKIYQLDARSLYFRIFNDTGIHHLVITLDDSPRLYVADTMPPTPDIPTGLCMFLRKYYENGRIASIAQLHLDRLIEIAVDVLDMSGRLVTRKIHVELMGKYSNVIFTEDGTIIEALIKTGKNKQALRTIAPKEPYAFPPNFMRMDPFAFSAQELTDMMETCTDEPLKTWMLKRFNGMGTIVLNELSHDSGIDAGRPVGDLSPADRFAWCRTVGSLWQAPGRYVRGLRLYGQGQGSHLPAGTAQPGPISAATSQRLIEIDRATTARTASQSANRNSCRRRIGSPSKGRARALTASEMKETKKMDTYKLYGDLLMIYAYEKHDHEKEVTVQNLLSEDQGKVTIPLNPAYSMTDNANRYYKRYSKMRNRKQMSAQLHEENQKHLDYLYSLEYALENTSTKDEIADIKAEMKQMNLISGHNRDKLKKESAQDILTLQADGLDIWVGRNNRQNDFDPKSPSL